MVIGGFLVGFGTRYAGGCTSGHAIMGISNTAMAIACGYLLLYGWRLYHDLVYFTVPFTIIICMKH
jgi:uncharacterized membrane protein YedE/YeeE